MSCLRRTPNLAPRDKTTSPTNGSCLPSSSILHIAFQSRLDRLSIPSPSPPIQEAVFPPPSTLKGTWHHTLEESQLPLHKGDSIQVYFVGVLRDFHPSIETSPRLSESSRLTQRSDRCRCFHGNAKTLRAVHTKRRLSPHPFSVLPPPYTNHSNKSLEAKYVEL
jgi:hypothetical protein